MLKKTICSIFAGLVIFGFSCKKLHSYEAISKRIRTEKNTYQLYRDAFDGSRYMLKVYKPGPTLLRTICNGGVKESYFIGMGEGNTGIDFESLFVDSMAGPYVTFKRDQISETQRIEAKKGIQLCLKNN